MNEDDKSVYYAGQQVVGYAVCVASFVLAYLQGNWLIRHPISVVLFVVVAVIWFLELRRPSVLVTAESLVMRTSAFREKVIGWSEIAAVKKKKRWLPPEWLEVTLASGEKARIVTGYMFEATKDRFLEEFEKHCTDAVWE